MLIELELGNNFFSQQKDPDEIDALENLGILIALGAHLVVGSRNVLKRLSQLDVLSRRSKNAFAKVHSSISQLQSSTGKITSRIILSNQCHAPTADGPNWRVPLSSFNCAGVLAKSELLAENVVDAGFYIGLALAYERQHVRAKLPIQLRPVGGGGATTAQNLEAALNEGTRFIFCIADGDRDWSGAAIGVVASQCNAILPDNRWNARFTHNFARTIENLVLFEWIQKTDFYSRNKALAESIGRVQNDCSEELVRFSNMKSWFGVCFYRYNQDVNVKTAMAEDVQKLEPNSICLPEKCSGKCFHFGGIHDAVRQVMDYLMTKPADAGRCMHSNSIQASLGKLLFEFGVAGAVIRA